jgi:hypothetical protein
MILILIALIAVIALCIWANAVGDWDNTFTDMVAPVFACAGLVGLFAYSLATWEYYAASYKKDIINREYGTSYTQLEVFYASDVIDTVRKLNRKRIEINGDLVTGE